MKIDNSQLIILNFQFLGGDEWPVTAALARAFGPGPRRWGASIRARGVWDATRRAAHERLNFLPQEIVLQARLLQRRAQRRDQLSQMHQLGLSVGAHRAPEEAKLSARATLSASGTLPENVNYAMKSSFLPGFLESIPWSQRSGRNPTPNAASSRTW